MRKVSLTLASLALSAIVLVGCSNGGQKVSPTTSEPAAQSESKPSAAPSSAPSSSPSSEASKSSEPSSAAAVSYPITIKHTSGETTLKAQPKRVVVFDMAALDSIDAMGLGDVVVGVPGSSIPTWLKDDQGIDYSKLPAMGSMKEPDMEAIAKIKPDLILIGGRMAANYEALSALYPTINSSVSWRDSVDNYSERVAESITQLGQILGHPAEAAKAHDQLEALMAKYKDLGKDKGSAMVIMTNAGEISAHGKGSRWAPIYELFGMKEAFQAKKADEGHKAEKLSFEMVQEANPDWIFVVDRDQAVGKKDTNGKNAEQVMDNELVASTNAAKNGHIVYLTPERWYIVMTGAANYEAMLTEVADALQK